jgi:transcriptional/translational regulatory protein YebC/TACO1
MADRGSVLFNFSRAGVVLVDAAPGEEAVLEAAMEAGATDVLPDEDEAGTVLAFKVGQGGLVGSPAGGAPV